jgi:hypothetical protein
MPGVRAQAQAFSKAVVNLQTVGLSDPPSWTRLEPQSVVGDPELALQASVHDPLWLLTRQWQFGEFQGESDGSPVRIELAHSTSRVTRWLGTAAGGAAAAAGRPLAEDELLEALVEAEPPVAEPDLGAAAEAGLRFLRAAADRKLTLDPAALTADRYVLTVPADATDPASRRLRTVARRCVDGRKLATRIKVDGAASVAGELAATAAERAQLAELLGGWRDWYAGEHPGGADAETWVRERLEYRFRLAAASAGGETVLEAPAFGGGRVEWWSFDAVRNAELGATADAAPQAQTDVVLPKPVHYTGQPSDRFWEFENGSVNLGALDAAPHDLARLLLVEFATAFGNDWFVVPLELPYGSLTTVDTLTVTTTFGDTYEVAAADGSWRMFAVTDTAGEGIPGLVLPPATLGLLEGEALEEVLFLRDEGANMAWGVERRVQGAAGAPVDRAILPPVPVAPRRTPPGNNAELDYVLETNVPDYWVPLLPVGGSGHLVRGALVASLAGGTVEPIDPRGRLLADDEHGRLWLYDEEVPREGVRVTRVPMLARRADGTYISWIGRRATVGRGEGSSGLAFDAALPRG